QPLKGLVSSSFLARRPSPVPPTRRAFGSPGSGHCGAGRPRAQCRPVPRQGGGTVLGGVSLAPRIRVHGPLVRPADPTCPGTEPTDPRGLILDLHGSPASDPRPAADRVRRSRAGESRDL